MKSKAIIASILIAFLFSCSGPKDSAGNTVGSETTNAISIVTLDGKSASFAKLYWVSPAPGWYSNLKNRDSLWILKATADTNGQLIDFPELSWKSKIFIHWQNQSMIASGLPELGDSLTLESSGSIKGTVSGKPLPKQVCLAGTWICSNVNQKSGIFTITNVPEGVYEMVGAHQDSLGVTKIVMLGSASVTNGDTSSYTIQAKFETITVLDFNNLADSKSPLSSKLGLESGYGYFVFEGDIDVDIPLGTDSLKPEIEKFLVQDSGRTDLAFHATMQTGAAFHFFHIGAKFDSSLSFRSADSIQFWSKGSCEAEIKFFEEDETNLAASYRFQPDSIWRQYRFSTTAFKIRNNLSPSDSLYNWKTINREFNHVVFASFGACKEFWVDDLEIVGASLDELIL